MSKADVVVVGAGLAGLRCAGELTARGCAVRLLEAGDRAGGRIATDLCDGYRLDRGFQVVQTAYDELPRALDLPALDLRCFVPGALIRYGDRFHRLADPWRAPLTALATLLSPIGTLGDKLRMAALRRSVIAPDLDALYARPETTALAALRARGFSEAMIERFFRPFFAGVFLDPTLGVSSRAFEFCFRVFALGDTAVPAAGMGAIPEQLAAGLPEGVLRTRTRVTAVEARAVTLASGERIDADAVVLATDGVNAARLLGDADVPVTCSTTCVYFAAERAPIDEPVLVLNGTGSGPVNSLVVPSLLSRHYAPRGDALVAVNVFGDPPEDDATLAGRVQAQVRAWFGAPVDRWRVLRTVRVRAALPRQSPPVGDPQRHAPRRADGLYVCGEYGHAPTLQWALQSGRRAAEAVLAR